MFFVTDDGVDFIGLAVNLLKVVLKLFDFPFQSLDVFEVGVSDSAGLKFSFIVHSELDGFDDSLEFHLS